MVDNNKIHLSIGGIDVRGRVVLQGRGFIAVEILSPYVHFTNFDFEANYKTLKPTSKPKKRYPGLFNKAERLLSETYKILKEIDQNLDRYTGIYKMVLEELEVVSRVLDVQLKMEMEDQLKWWFYNEITGREHDAKKLSTYCGEQFLNIFHQYAAIQRKIYSPFGY